MQAVVRDKYGSPDVLSLEEVPTPTPAANEVLVRVHAAAVNKADWEILHGSPLWVRLVGFGLMRPKARILGSNLAGSIAAIGQAVSQFEEGDEICGDILSSGLGAFAEYVCVPEDAVIVRKPANLTFEEAASVPEAGLIALRAIRDKAQLQSGQKVLVNGAGGGAGTFAIQLAKSAGAQVTGVDSSAKLDLMRALGADHVIDYTLEDISRHDSRYDLILDTVGVGPIGTWKRMLRPRGIYLAAGGTVAQVLRTLLIGAWVRWTTEMCVGVLAVKYDKAQLAAVIELLGSGQVAATIDRSYPLRSVPDAFRYLGAGHSKGKVVITV